MLPFTNTPWQVEEEFITDSTGTAIIQLWGYHLNQEEFYTLLRAISQLPAILEVLDSLKGDANKAALLGGHHLELINGLLAYIYPIENGPEVATGRWLHAHQSEAATPATIQQLTYALRQQCDENLNQYPPHVQSAFAYALSQLNLAKHRELSADIEPVKTVAA